MESFEQYKKPYKANFLDVNPLEKQASYTKISCPSCNSEIAADGINLNDKIAKCNSCNAICSIHDEVQKLFKSSQKVKQEIARPESIEKIDYEDEIDLVIKQPDSWVDWMFYIIVPIVVMIGMGILKKSGGDPKSFIIIALPIFGSLVYFIKRQYHKVYLTIDQERLHIRWRPSKLIKDKSYHVRSIKQVYVKKHADLGRHNVMMILDEGDGQKHLMLTAIKTISEAKYLEQEIEKQLQIQDVVVPEEDK